MADKMTPEQIVSVVEQQERNTEALRSRMMDDYSLYRLDPFKEYDKDGNPVEGYRYYTTNEPRTLAEKIISWQVEAELIIRSPMMDKRKPQRDMDNAREQFCVGILKLADERLLMTLQPPLREQAAFQSTVRGWICGLWTLSRDPDSEDEEQAETVVNVIPWDPAHTYWEVSGAGLAWACYKIKKTRAMIKAEYGVDLPDDPESDDHDDDINAGVDVYDFFDRTHNTVIAADLTVLKESTEHGGVLNGKPVVPVVIVPVGATPLLQPDDTTDPIADYGESVFAPNRENWDSLNLMMSIYLELAARARKPGHKVYSADGTLTLDDDPNMEGTDISLQKDRQDVQPLEQVETTRDAAVILQAISGEAQRGGLPYSVYGSTPFQLSGYAINTLRQGVESVLMPRVKAIQYFYTQGLRLLAGQYATGAYSPLRLRGHMRMARGMETYFDEQITPEQISRSTEPEIRLVPALPQDDASKWAQVKIAREGEIPIVTDRWLRDSVLAIQDADDMDAAVKEQLAERLLPEAKLYELMMAAADQGNEQLAKLYEMELRFVFFMKQQQRQQAMMGGMPPGQGQPGTGGGGMDPKALPNAAQGKVARPIQQAGPLVPQGQPRPGAQQRLNNIGLVGPGG